MKKAILSSLILIAHIGFVIWYARLDYSYKELYANEMIAAFCGTAFILPGINNGMSSVNDGFPQWLIYKFHNLFCLFIGTIYVCHYTGYFITTNNIQFSIYCSIFLTIFTVGIICFFKHRLFKKQKTL